MPKSAFWATWDIESEDWTRFRVGVVHLGDVDFVAWTVPELVAALREGAVNTRGRRVYWAHFGGKFDIKFILPELARCYDLGLTAINGSLVRIKVKDRASGKKLYELRDSFNILQFSLAKLAKTFGVGEKMAVDRRRIEDLSNDEVAAYCASDCRLLLDIIHSARVKFGVEDFKMTIASQAMSEWRKLVGEEYEAQLHANARLDPFLRESYYGGRVEVFRRQARGVKCYDVRSMYPYVMRAKEYPAGRTARTKRFDPHRLGIYRCRVTCPASLDPPLLPVRQDGKLLFPTGTWEGVYCSPEIKEARRIGYTIDVLEGVVWSSRTRPFSAYVDKWYAVKAQADKDGDEALRMIAKLYLNSLYGKTGQRRVFEKLTHGALTREMVAKGCKDVFPELNLFSVKDVDRSPFTMVQLASFVTSYARLHLYSHMRSVPSETLVYCDTDSIITQGSKLRIGQRLGDMALEYEADEGVFLAPKLYGMRSSKGEKVRAKGMQSSDVTYAKLEGVLRGEQLSSSREGIMGLLEAAKRVHSPLAKRTLVRTFGGSFTKRVLVGERTAPVVVTA